ncbi:hypothetical protein A4X09_0g7670 [Tilletia walkeri]|uniref:Uncharacterized protein n=1 Tax=Tilletia walkeri TaxID=117179 RepID=A0A8X7N2S4_9BASI|nr:hypothetical protein A4X09_0g7670 [Tilletia walkeri]
MARSKQDPQRSLPPTRAGPADIVHLGVLDAGQQQQQGSSSPSALAAGSISAALDELGTSNSRGKLAAEIALPLVVLPPDVLLWEIEHDQLVEQWEEDLKRRRAEAAAFNHAAAVGGSSNGSGSNSNSNTQRQRRRRGSNRMEDGSPTLAGMSFFASSRKPWLPDPVLVAGGVGGGVGTVDVDPDPETVRPIVAHCKEGSGPVRKAGAGGAPDGGEMEGHVNSDHKLHREEGRDEGTGDSDEDQGSGSGSGNGDGSGG